MVPVCRRLTGDIPGIPTCPWGNELGQAPLVNPIFQLSQTISIFPLKDFSHGRCCHTVLGQTQEEEMSFEYREGKGWPLAVSGDVDKAPPKAAMVTLS